MKPSEDDIWIDKVGAPQMLALITQHLSSPTISNELIIQGTELLVNRAKGESRERRDLLAGFIIEMRALRSAGSLGYAIGP